MSENYYLVVIGALLGAMFVLIFQLVEFVAYKYPQFWFGKKAFIKRMQKLKRMKQECENEFNNEN